MSTSDFKNTYVIAIILTLLVGVGLGYQINTLVDNTNENAGCDTTTSSSDPSSSSPREIGEVFSHTGLVESVASDTITFTALIQNTDASYTKTTLKVSMTSDTTFTKIDLRDTTAAEETITIDDIAVGNEIVAIADENIYGKTQFTASAIKLHQF